MFIVGMLSWWYGAGWRQRITILQERLLATFDYFSIDLLAKTLFLPFRQISAGTVNGPLDAKIRAFFDQLVSRIIGMMVRSTVMVIGVGALFLQVLTGVLSVVVWAFIPLLPIVGLLLFISGWVPWNL